MNFQLANRSPSIISQSNVNFAIGLLVLLRAWHHGCFAEGRRMSAMKLLRKNYLPFVLYAFAFASLLTTPSFAARCGGDFNSFVSSISAEAQSAGISQGVIASAF